MLQHLIDVDYSCMSIKIYESISFSICRVRVCLINLEAKKKKNNKTDARIKACFVRGNNPTTVSNGYVGVHIDVTSHCET